MACRALEAAVLRATAPLPDPIGLLCRESDLTFEPHNVSKVDKKVRIFVEFGGVKLFLKIYLDLIGPRPTQDYFLNF